MDRDGTADRLFKEGAYGAIGVFEPWIGRIDGDGADDGSRGTETPRHSRLRDELVQQVTDAATTTGTDAPFQPGEIVGVERDRNRLPCHSMFIVYELRGRLQTTATDRQLVVGGWSLAVGTLGDYELRFEQSFGIERVTVVTSRSW